MLHSLKKWFGITLLCFGTSVNAQDELQNYALILKDNLPHLMKTIMKHKSELKLTQEQQQTFKKLKQTIPPKMHQGLHQAQTLEKAIAKDVLIDGATPQKLTQKLDELTSIKRQTTETMIGALNTIRSTLTPEQYQTVLNHYNQPNKRPD